VARRIPRTEAPDSKRPGKTSINIESSASLSLSPLANAVPMLVLQDGNLMLLLRGCQLACCRDHAELLDPMIRSLLDASGTFFHKKR